MFSEKKSEHTKRRNHNLAQFGLTDTPDDFDPSLSNDDDDDSNLEAELTAIAGSGEKKPKPKPKPQVVSGNELDKMIADSLKDVGSDDDDGEDLENDAELLDELKGIVGDDIEDVTTEGSSVKSEECFDGERELLLSTTDIETIGVIKQRIEMYKVAEENAKIAGESAKMRRFNRGLQSLNKLLQNANSGKGVKLEDIPPEVSNKPAATEDNSEVPSDIPNLMPLRRAPSPPKPLVEEARTKE